MLLVFFVKMLTAQPSAGFSVDFFKKWEEEGFSEKIHDVALLADGRLLVAGEREKKGDTKGKQAFLTTIDPDSGERGPVFSIGDFGEDAFFSVTEAADGSWYAAGRQRGGFSLLVRFEDEGQKTTIISTESAHLRQFDAVGALADGTCLVVSLEKDTLFGWSVHDGILSDLPLFEKTGGYFRHFFGVKKAESGGLWLIGEGGRRGKNPWAWLTDQHGQPEPSGRRAGGGNPEKDETVLTATADAGGHLMVGGRTFDSDDGGETAWFCENFAEPNRGIWTGQRSGSSVGAVCFTRSGQRILAIKSEKGRENAVLQPLSEGLSAGKPFGLPRQGGIFDPQHLLEMPSGKLVLMGDIDGSPAIYSIKKTEIPATKSSGQPVFSIENARAVGSPVLFFGEKTAIAFSVKNRGGHSRPSWVTIEAVDEKNRCFQEKTRPTALPSLGPGDSVAVFCGVRADFPQKTARFRVIISMDGADAKDTVLGFACLPRPILETEKPSFLLPEHAGIRWKSRFDNLVKVKFYTKIEHFDPKNCRLRVGQILLGRDELGTLVANSNERADGGFFPKIATMRVSLPDSTEQVHSLVFEWFENGSWRGASVATAIEYRRDRPAVFVLPIGVPDIQGGLDSTVSDARKFAKTVLFLQKTGFFEEIWIDSTFLSAPEKATQAAVSRQLAELQRRARAKVAGGGSAEVFFFFSGHGEMNGAFTMLQCMDGPVALSGFLPYFQVENTLVFCFLDACRQPSDGQKKPAQRENLSENVAIFQSSGRGQRSFECAEGGIFTEKTCAKLREAALQKSALSAPEFADFLEKTVKIRAIECAGENQVPQFYPPDGQPDLMLFSPPKP